LAYDADVDRELECSVGLAMYVVDHASNVPMLLLQLLLYARESLLIKQSVVSWAVNVVKEDSVYSSGFMMLGSIRTVPLALCYYTVSQRKAGHRPWII
jgi:hypothetical protein